MLNLLLFIIDSSPVKGREFDPQNGSAMKNIPHAMIPVREGIMGDENILLLGMSMNNKWVQS